MAPLLVLYLPSTLVYALEPSNSRHGNTAIWHRDDSYRDSEEEEC
jgi:hypothetical protein